MARRLDQAGYRIQGWTRTAATAAWLNDIGTLALTTSAAVHGARAIIVSLPDSATVDAVLLHDETTEAISPGAIVIDTSSTDPDSARRQSDYLRGIGVHHLDAPVSGGTRGAGAGELAIMVGGDPDTFSAAEGLLATLGRPTLIGPSGAGQLAKLCNQIIVAVTIGAVAEGLALADQAGGSLARIVGALHGGFADSRILREHGERMIQEDFSPGGAVRLQLKDLTAALGVAESHGLNLRFTKLARDLYQQLVGDGYGDFDHSALYLATNRTGVGGDG